MTDYLKIIRDTEKWLESRGESIPKYLSGKQTKTPESVFSITNNIKDKPMAKVTAVQVLKEAAELKERRLLSVRR